MKENFAFKGNIEAQKKPILEIKKKMFGVNTCLKLEKESDPVSFTYDHKSKSLNVGFNQDLVLRKLMGVFGKYWDEKNSENDAKIFSDFLKNFKEEEITSILEWIKCNFEEDERRRVLKKLCIMDHDQVMKVIKRSESEARMILGINKMQPSALEGFMNPFRQRMINYLKK
jgi:hypothetical protein